MIATLRRRDFALYWLGGFISLAGDWVLTIGLPIYVYILTKSVLASSLAVIAGTAPTILLGSVAGVFVDRWDRKRTVVLTNILIGLSLLPLLLVRTPGDVWIVYAAFFVAASIEQFLTPAQDALVPRLVGEDHLAPANALTGLSNNLARLFGPAIGGLAAALFGLEGIVLIDVASYGVAALLTGLIVTNAAPAQAAEGSLLATELGAIGRVWREWADGLRLILSNRALTVLLAVFTVSAFGEGVFAPLFPVFVYQELHGVAVQIGELMSAQAVGGLLGGLIVGWLGQRVMSRWVAGFGWVAFGVIALFTYYAPALIPFAWANAAGTPPPFPVFWIVAGLFAAVGVPGIIAATGTKSRLQATAPDAYRGRVFGALGATTGLAALAGSLIAGFATDALGLIPVLDMQGVAKILAGLLMLTLLPLGTAITSAEPSLRTTLAGTQ
jgi:MFS family permease